MLLAGSADAGYVTFLRRYCEESGLAARLTLVESVPFPASFRDLSAKFHNTKCETVFRDSKLVVEQGSLHNSSRPTYAITAAGRARPETPDPATPNPQPAQCTYLNRVWLRPMRLNAQEQRIDEPLRSWEKPIEIDVRRRRLCPRHFLTECNEPRCSRRHEGTINDEEKAALMRIARDDPCDKGTRCYDRRCVSAHSCPYDGRCDYGDDCKYGLELHNVDKRIVASR